MCCFFNNTATAEIYTLSLHDALPIFSQREFDGWSLTNPYVTVKVIDPPIGADPRGTGERAPHIYQLGHEPRSEEHTSELQSRQYLVCRLLLEKKKEAFRSTLDLPVLD